MREPNRTLAARTGSTCSSRCWRSWRCLTWCSDAARLELRQRRWWFAFPRSRPGVPVSRGDGFRCGPAAYWLLAAGFRSLTAADPSSPESLFLMGLAAAFRSGTFGRPAGWPRTGDRVGAAATLVYNIPGAAVAELVFIPVDLASSPGLQPCCRARAEQAEVAESRGDTGRARRVEERVRIARDLHDVVAHHVSMMGVQAATLPAS